MAEVLVGLMLSIPSMAETITAPHSLLGKKVVVRHESAANLSQDGIHSTTEVRLFNKTHSLLESSLEVEPKQVPIARHDVYLHGTRIWTSSARIERGGLVYSGGIAPTQISFPLLIYPLGPLILQVDAGVEFEGKVEASVLPGISIPIEDMSIDAGLKTDLYAAGYLEGYAKLLFVRGGVGGRINLIEGSTSLSASVFFNGTPVLLNGFGSFTVLSGQAYGFVDSRNLFGGWTRWFTKRFYHYSGKCFAFGGAACGFQ